MTQPTLSRILGEPYHAPATTINAPDHVSTTIGVYEDIERKKLYIPAAGYTKPVSYYPGHEDPEIDELLKDSAFLKKNRQTHIYEMHKAAPLGAIIHGIAMLVREPQNSYDKNAIQIIGRLVEGQLWKYVLGYVPAKINTKILTEWDRVSTTGLVNILKDSKGHLVPMITLDFLTLAPDNRFARLQL